HGQTDRHGLVGGLEHVNHPGHGANEHWPVVWPDVGEVPHGPLPCPEDDNAPAGSTSSPGASSFLPAATPRSHHKPPVPSLGGVRPTMLPASYSYTHHTTRRNWEHTPC